MRVLMISHLFPSMADEVNGCFVHSQAVALKDIGCEVKVIAPTAAAPFPLYFCKDKWQRFHDTPRRDCYLGVEVVYPRVIRTPGAVLFEYSGLDYFRAIRYIAREWQKDKPFDLVHAQVAYPDGWAAAKLCGEMGLPLVITVHGQELQKIILWKKKLKKLVLATLSKADAVAVPSQKILALAEANGIKKSRLHLVYNGVDPLPEAELPDEIQEKVMGKKVLLSVCRLEQVKGVDLNLLAMKQLILTFPDLVYIIVGQGSYEPKLRAMAKRLGLGDHVIFAGYQPRNIIQAFYSSSHVFSMPSRDESFGIVYLEALATGLPVVGTLGEGIAPVISESGAGKLVEYGNVSGLVQAISQLLNSVNQLSIRDAGRKLSSCFLWKDNARSMLKLYNTVIRCS